MQGRGHSCSPRRRKRLGRGGGGGYGVRLGGPLGLRKDRLELRKTFVHLLRGQDEWRQQAQRVFVRAVDEQTLFERLGDVRSAIDVQVHTQHQSFSADFADEIKFGGEFLQTRAQLRATRANIGEQALAFDWLEEGQSRGAHQRAAAKRGTVEAGRKRRGKLLARHESAQREPARERFCNHDNVRQSRKTCVRKSQPRAAQAALNFVGDQRCAMLRCQFAGTLPKCVADGKNSTLALHRLDDDRANIAGEFRFQVRDVVEADEFRARDKRLEWFPVFQRVRDRKGAKRATMKGILERQHAYLSFTAGFLTRRDTREF